MFALHASIAFNNYTSGSCIFEDMVVNTVIFDMDGVLIDSEPFWQEAGKETLARFDAALTTEQYHHTTGLRTNEWIDYWFKHFGIDQKLAKEAEEAVIAAAIEKIRANGTELPGVKEIFGLFKSLDFKIGLATSSPMELVDVVVEKLGLQSMLDTAVSAEHLVHGKPHPEVYMVCAEQLKSHPLECICFEDSFNGMISVKAARMKCAVIPAPDQIGLAKWGAADLQLTSLIQFNASML